MMAGPLVIALLLDAMLGEPKWLWDRAPHPAVVIGRLIGWADRRFNAGDARRLKGVCLVVMLVALSIGTGAVLAALPGFWSEVIVAGIFLAQRSLAQHVSAVADGLRLSLGDGRLAVSNIVGRDTRDMDASAVSRGAIESAAENFSDGVIAPAFWFLIGGLPGLIAYKAINTADSMIGYLTPRHQEFGWAAARLDDLVNWIPARLTAGLIWLVAGMRGPWTDIASDAALHRSPNAGWPEAAMARAVGVAVSGPRSYDGEMRDFPFVNAGGRRTAGPDDIEASVAKLWQSWTLFLALVLCVTAL